MKPYFQKLLTRKYSVLMDDIIVQSWLDAGRFSKLTGIKEYMNNVEIIDGAFCLDMNWMGHVYEKYRQKPLWFFLDFCKKGYTHGEKIRKFVRNLNLSKNKKETEKYFWESLDLLENLIVFVAVTHPLAKVVETKVRDILSRKKIKPSEFEETLVRLTQPRKRNTPLVEQIDLDKIRRNRKKPSFNLRKELKKHFDKYSFLGYRQPFSSGFDLEFFEKRLKEKEIIKKKEKVDIKLSSEEKEQVNAMREMVFFRNYRTEKMVEAFYYLEKLWNKVGNFYNLTENEIAHYQIGEVKNLFEKGSRVNKDIIDLRKQAHGYVAHDGRVGLILGKELDKKIKQYSVNEQDVNDIKGSIACSGLANGIIKVVLDSREQNKVKQNDILVTTMTTPDFLPAMKLASAFITDEGGITCHAAIVAREMKKPCIIGTKIATKVLRDGDLVEVDADKGVVRIIKKNK